MPRYESETGQIFFDADAVEVDRLTLAGKTGTSEDDLVKRKRLAEVASSIVQHVAEAAIKAYLANRPVYRFGDNFAGAVAKATLRDVAIEQGAVLITFSIWTLLIGAAIFALVLTGALYLGSILVGHFRRA